MDNDATTIGKRAFSAAEGLDKVIPGGAVGIIRAVSASMNAISTSESVEGDATTALWQMSYMLEDAACMVQRAQDVLYEAARALDGVGESKS